MTHVKNLCMSKISGLGNAKNKISNLKQKQLVDWSLDFGEHDEQESFARATETNM